MTAAARRPLPPLPPTSSIERVHIIGICGTAMGTLAAMFAERGLRVRGSDAMAYPPMSTWLEERGLVIQSGYAAEHIAADTQLVVVGNVSRVDNPEAVAARERGLPMVSLPEALRLFFFEGHSGLVVTGTHGKSTTTAMCAWALHETGRDPSFFLGGVLRELHTNYRLGEGGLFVVEGDEYDTAYFDKVPKFWHYPAAAATINNVEHDHVDIYPTFDDVRHVFARFAAQVTDRLFVNGDDAEALAASAHASCGVTRFGLGAENDLRAEITGVDEAGTHVRVSDHRGTAAVEVGAFTLPTVGAFNVRNALGASLLSEWAGVPLADALTALTRYPGVKKRQEIRGRVGDILVIDDFAHHPTAVASTVAALRERYASRRLVVAFEAKSNTTRRALFQSAYPPAFAGADVVVLSRPWKKDNLPASELLSIERLADDIRALGVEVHLIEDVDEIVVWAGEALADGDVFAGLSGSAFGGLHDRVIEALSARG